MKTLLAALVGGIAFFAASAIAGGALAGGCGCTPPPCCTPPSPPPPPSTPCCQPPGHTINIPGVSVNVAATVVVDAQVSAQAQAQAQAGASSNVVLNSGGGGGFTALPGPTGLIQNFNVEGGQMNRVAYEASRTLIKKVVIQAFCLDDKDIPHPASQVSPDKDIEDAFDGELFRCIAGTHMQYVIAEYDGRIDFTRGQTLSCNKGEALYHSPGGHVECRAQKPARDCNERSLLRRFGAGVKILTMIRIEKYTAYREEESHSVSSGGALSLDGGVGGVVY